MAHAGIPVADLLRAAAGLAPFHGYADRGDRGQTGETVQGLHRVVQAGC